MDLDDGRVSDIVHWQLMREAMQRKAVGAADAANEKAGRSRDGAARQVKLGSREEFGGHQADGPSPARQSRPVLRVVSSRQRATGRRTSVTPCLVLIVGGRA